MGQSCVKVQLYNPLDISCWQSLGLRLNSATPRLFYEEFKKQGDPFCILWLNRRASFINFIWSSHYACDKCSIRIKCKTLHYQVRTVATGSYSWLQPQCYPGLRRGAPWTLTGLTWPAQPHPGPLHTPAHGPGPHPGQPGVISLCPSGTTQCQSPAMFPGWTL